MVFYCLVALPEEALSEIKDFEIEVGKVTLWTRENEGKVTVARLNWHIVNTEPLINMHKALLTVPGYYLFKELEQEKYNPHISLGAVDMTDYSNLEHVQNYLDNKEFETHKFTLKDFALNLTSVQHTEVVPLKIA